MSPDGAAAEEASGLTPERELGPEGEYPMNSTAA